MSQAAVPAVASHVIYPCAPWFRTLVILLGVLMCITIVGVIIGIPLFILAARYRAEVNGDQVAMTTIRRVTFNLSEVASVEQRVLSGALQRKINPHLVTLTSRKKVGLPVGAFKGGADLLALVQAAAARATAA